MSKKRVHEIAKELKNHGIELDNKETVTELAALGYDVKSHSSTLDDDDATVAVEQIVRKRRGKQEISRALAPKALGLPPVRPASGFAAPTAEQAKVAASTRTHPSDQRPHAAQKGGKIALTSAPPQPAGSRAKRPNAPLPVGVSKTRPSASKGLQPSYLFVDGSNICRFFGKARLDLLHRALQYLRTRFESADLRVIVDASLRYCFDKGSNDRKVFEAKTKSGEWEQAPAGSEADTLIFKYMSKYADSCVISNDQFKDARTAPPDLAQRHLRFHVDPKDGEFFLLED